MSLSIVFQVEAQAEFDLAFDWIALAFPKDLCPVKLDY